MSELPAKPRIKWYRTPIAADDLARLNQRSDWRGWLQTIGFLATLAVSGGTALYAVGKSHWLIVLALIYLHGALYAFLVNGFHELCHKTVSRRPRSTSYFAISIASLGWYNHVSFWASHQAHHRYTLHPPDDLEVVLPVKLNTHVLSCLRLHQSAWTRPASEIGIANVLRHYH